MSSVTFIKKSRKNIRRKQKTLEDDDAFPGDAQTTPTPKNDTQDDDSEGEGKDLSLEELVELRKLRQKKAGVAAEELLIGDMTQKKKKKDKTPVADPWKLSSGGGLVDLDEVRRSEDGAPRSTTLNSFTKQTNTLDVDKHMMNYIEEEMRRRKGMPAAGDDDKDQMPAGALSGDMEILNQLGIRQKQAENPDQQEGNVQLSTTMLSAIPEVDLGINERLRNIEETERAKRKLYEDKNHPSQTPHRNSSGNSGGSGSGGNRFRQQTHVLSDHERASRHHHHHHRDRDQQNNPHIPNTRFQTHHGHQRGAGRGMATDDIVMERFKKRMRR
ncbi:hypothetical protein DFQ26_005639 [Actinomortierella ambigua]|nr:hypothetical protein DFQ26_005639 [Actinomortierella ambigua]